MQSQPVDRWKSYSIGINRAVAEKFSTQVVTGLPDYGEDALAPRPLPQAPAESAPRKVVGPADRPGHRRATAADALQRHLRPVPAARHRMAASVAVGRGGEQTALLAAPTLRLLALIAMSPKRMDGDITAAASNHCGAPPPAVLGQPASIARRAVPEHAPHLADPLGRRTQAVLRGGRIAPLRRDGPGIRHDEVEWLAELAHSGRRQRFILRHPPRPPGQAFVQTTSSAPSVNRFRRRVQQSYLFKLDQRDPKSPNGHCWTNLTGHKGRIGDGVA